MLPERLERGRRVSLKLCVAITAWVGAHSLPKLDYPDSMLSLLLNWIASAASLLLVAHFVRGFEVSSFFAAMIAAGVVGLVNATLGVILKVVTFPLTIVTFGIFWLVINALMLQLAAMLVPGFAINGFAPAFWGAIALSIINLLFRVIGKSLSSSEQR
jgi:putative membrane protein